MSNKPIQTQGTVRDYADGNYGPAHIASFGIAPSGPNGAHCREYALKSDHFMAPAFIVDASNDHSFWKFANETNHNETALKVTIARDNLGRDIVTLPNGQPAVYEGRATGTDQPFGHFKDLPKGVPLFLRVEVAVEQKAGFIVPATVNVPLWLQAAD